MCTAEVRLCRQDDLPGVMFLMTELQEVAHGSNHFDLEHLSLLFAEMEKLPKIYLNLVAEISGTIVGYMSVIFYRTLFHKDGTALINELVITHGERSKGIGQDLVQRAIEEALARGLDELEVGTEKTNHGAQRFYRKCGFDQEFVLLGMEFD